MQSACQAKLGRVTRKLPTLETNWVFLSLEAEMPSKNSYKISNFPSCLYFRQKRMTCKQPIDQICLLSQEDSWNSNITMAKWKGLGKMKVYLPMFSVKVHAVKRHLQGWLGPSLTTKAAPLLQRKVSGYTSQCDQGNITVVVCVMRISLCIRDRRFLG